MSLLQTETQRLVTFIKEVMFAASLSVCLLYLKNTSTDFNKLQTDEPPAKWFVFGLDLDQCLDSHYEIFEHFYYFFSWTTVLGWKQSNLSMCIPMQIWIQIH